MTTIEYVDSHTGGEPTRTVIAGGPDLGHGPLAERLEIFSCDYDHIRSAVVNEPRGSDVMVGALLCEPDGVIFFNNVGYLGMCGHGTIGLIASLAYMGKVTPGVIRVETPVGVVEATLHAPSLRGASDSERRSNLQFNGQEIASGKVQERPRNDEQYPNKVSVQNIPSYRHLTHVPVIVDGKTVHGDVAWGGNWFFLVHDHGMDVNMSNLEALTDFSWRVREQLTANGITGANGAEIDHVELFASTPEADSKSFVLCPGKAYDRSPCGTGTSAKLACLYGDGKLQVGQTWKQQSVVGSIFEGSIQLDGDKIIPTITGEAWVMSEGTILVDERDPFGKGI